MGEPDHNRGKREVVELIDGGETSDDVTPVERQEVDDAVVKPLDGGWGWMVVVGFMIHMFLPASIIRSFTFLYLAMLDRFHQSDTLTSITLAITLSSYFIFSFLGGCLSNRYSARRLSLIGSVFYLAGLITTAFATSVYVVYLGFGLFLGIGMSLTLAPAMVIANRYFKEKKSLAFGLANMAKGLASFTMPPLLEFLLDFYGWSGALLLFGGIVLHSFVGSLLYRPLEDNFPKIRRNIKSPLLASTIEQNLGRARASSALEMDTLMAPSEKTKSDALNEETVRLNGENKVDAGDVVNEPNMQNVSGKKKRPLVHLNLLRDFRFMCFTIGLFFFNLGLNSVVYLAALGKENDYCASRVTIFVAAFGVSDLVGALVAGYILDLKIVRKKRYHINYIIYFVNALASFGLGLAKDYILFLLFVILKGTTLSIFWMRVPIMSDLIGDEKMASGVAITSPVFGIGNLCGPIIGGLLKDKLKSYEYVMHFAGVCGVVCSLIMCMGLFDKKCRQRTDLNLKEMVKNNTA